MVKVKNVKVTDIPFESKDKNFQQCIEYIKSVAPGGEYKKYLPHKPKQKLSFELTDANSDLANTIRRFLMDEISVLSMNIDEEKISTNDRFILTDYLKKNMELIPISQNIPEDVKISLNVENKTDEIIPVYSRDITITDRAKKKLNAMDYFSGTIPIIQLRPNSSLEISDINIVKGCGKEDSGKFLLLSNISYEILDMEPITQNKYTTKGESSLIANPTHFRIEFTNHRNISVKKVIILCCDEITRRLNLLLKELSNVAETTSIHFSDLIKIETKGDIKIFHFNNEYWTISNIISKYCYLTFKEIQFVCSSIIHPSTEESMVKIRHPQALKIITNAIKKILSDVVVIKSAFR